MEIAMEEVIIKNGDVTQAHIEHWKAQYGEDQVKEIVVPLEDEKTIEETDESGNVNLKEIPPARFVAGYFRKPDLQIIAAASKFMETDFIKALTIQMDSCFLGGAPDFKTNDEVRRSAMEAVNQMFKVRRAHIKNL